jgi:hypothetical protein
MVEVAIEVRSGATHFRAAVRAGRIREALSLVGGRYPGGEVRVLFPIEPQGFCVADESSARAWNASAPSEPTWGGPRVFEEGGEPMGYASTRTKRWGSGP